MKIAIYGGNGTSPLTRNHLIYTLNKFFNHPQITLMYGRDIRRKLDRSYDLFCIPGGGSSQAMFNEIKYTGMLKIREFVMRAGKRYLGICAGAYIACKITEFKTPAEHLYKHRPLQFYKGKKIGPVNGRFNYSNSIGVDVVKLVDSTGLKFNGYINGAGYFFNPEHYEDSEIILNYADPRFINNEAAGMLCRPEKGKALLLAPHLEYISDQLITDPYYFTEPMKRDLMIDDPLRHTFWEHYLTRLMQP